MKTKIKHPPSITPCWKTPPIKDLTSCRNQAIKLQCRSIGWILPKRSFHWNRSLNSPEYICATYVPLLWGLSYNFLYICSNRSRICQRNVFLRGCGGISLSGDIPSTKKFFFSYFWLPLGLYWQQRSRQPHSFNDHQSWGFL